MNLIKSTLLLLAISIYSVSIFGQTFTYVESRDLTDETDDADELCMAIFNGKIFIQDEGDDEIDIYDASNPYGFIDDFGGDEFGNSEDGILFHNGFIFVVDDSDDDIEVFNASPPYSWVTKINVSDELDDIEGIAISCNKIFVVDNSQDLVGVFSATAPYGYITSFGGDELINPAGIATYGSNVYVVDEGDDQIHVFTCTNYEHITSFGSGGDDEYGEGIAIVCNYILVLDSDADGRVDVYNISSTYDYVTTFGQAEIGNVECIAVDGNLIYVVDADPDNGDHELDIFRLEDACAPIPTLSQWGIIALSMIMLIFGVVAVRQRKVIFS